MTKKHEQNGKGGGSQNCNNEGKKKPVAKVTETV